MAEDFEPVEPQEEEPETDTPRRRRPESTETPAERAILVGVYRSARERPSAEESLDELQALADAAGAITVVRVMQERERPDPGRFIGKGKVEEIKNQVAALPADLLIFDDNLTPRQKANLEDAVAARVIDRTQLILDIFAQRAHTREGKLQVELAQLKYLLPRLIGRGIELSRLGGGIGTRGPGETKLEMDRRRLKRRIQLLEEEIEKVRRTRVLHRQRRKENGVPTIALVGYTNAGKSTLFTRLTQAETFVSPQLFATLDPLLRRARLPNGQTVDFSDTVGFIKKLPHDLVVAFRATLEEVNEADLLLHVVDISEEHFREQMAVVEQVLTEMGVPDIPRIHVFNKIDRVTPSPDAARHLTEKTADRPVSVSALTGEGIDALLRLIGERLEDRILHATFEFPYDKGQLMAWLRSKGKVLSENYTEKGILLEVEIVQSLVEAHHEIVPYMKSPSGVRGAPSGV